MSKYCPIVKKRVIYQFCEDCEEKKCKGEKKNVRSETMGITKHKST